MASILLTRNEARGELPPTCVCCGAPAVVFRKKREWYPPWVNVFVFLGIGFILVAPAQTLTDTWANAFAFLGIGFLCLLIIIRDRQTLNLPFCRTHHNHWLMRTLVVWLLLLGIFLVFPFLQILFEVMEFTEEGPLEKDYFLLSFVGGWITLAMTFQYTAIRPKLRCTILRSRKVTEQSICLTGVCESFIAAVEEHRLKQGEILDADLVGPVLDHEAGKAIQDIKQMPS